MAPQEQTTMIKLPGMAAAALLFSGAVIAQDPEQMETVLVMGLCGRSAGRPSVSRPAMENAGEAPASPSR